MDFIPVPASPGSTLNDQIVESPESKPESSTVSRPFDAISLPTGGVILKSSDGARFHVYKNILMLSSSLFADMFTIPQPTNVTQTVRPNEEAPEIELSEDSKTVDILLRMIYPTDPPTFSGQAEDGTITDSLAFIRNVEEVLAAALKYDMTPIVRLLCSRLVEIADETLPDGTVADETLALRVFIISCKHGLRKVASLAAHATLRGRSAGVFIPELREITAAQYYNLVNFNSKIADAIMCVMKGTVLPSDLPSAIYCLRCSNNGIPGWWLYFIDKAGPILKASPRSKVPFTANFQNEVSEKADKCSAPKEKECCKRSFRENWNTVCRYLEDLINRTIDENPIDLSEIL